MMAGKFLSIDEAANHLGVTPERVRQLVDRRLISALRDTAGPRFRPEDLDRFLADAADEAAAAGTAPPEDIAPESASPPADDADSVKDASGLSLDGLEFDLGDSAEASIIIQEPEAESSPQAKVEESAVELSLEPEDELGLASGIDLDGTESGSGPVTSSQDRAAAPAAEEASLVLSDAIEESPADGPLTLVGMDDSLVIGDDDLSDAKPATGAEDDASLVIGDETEAAPADGPQTLVGADESLVFGEDDSGVKPPNIADAASLVAGDDIELSGLDMSLAGSLSGLELEDAAAGPAAGGSAVQGGSLGGSFGSDLDLESLVAGSAIAPDAAAESFVVEDSLAGSDLLGDDLAVAEPVGAEGSGILVDSGAGDIGSQLSGGSGVIMEGGIDLTGDDVKPWDVDLGEFMNDVEEDADAPTMLGGGGEFDLDAEATAEDPSQSADIASESQVGGDSSFFDKSQGPADSSFFGDTAGGPGAGPGGATPLSEMASSSMYGLGIDTKFNGWQVTGLICCSLLLLIGGLLTFDLVRTIGSPDDTPLANTIVGGLAYAFGWSQ